MNRQASLGLLLGLVGVTLFGATVPATRFAVHWLDPAFLTFARASLAGLLAAGILLVRRSAPPWRRGLPTLDFLIVAGCLMVGFPLLMAYGSVTVPSSHAGVVLGILPLATTLAATLLSGERPSLGFFALSILGCALVVAFALRNGGAEGFGAGDAMLGVGAVLCAIGYAVSGRLSRRVPGWEVICWALTLGLPLALPMTLILLPPGLESVPAPAWAALVYVAAISQLVAFFFWNTGLALGGISRVGQLQLLQTFLIVVLSWPINGEAPDLETYLFMVAVMAVVALGQKTKVTVAAIPAE
ncbi:DMT family transporter [Aquabacter spiritensis]|uniref:Drug/metabolite transporter (DMT)-like permease n=1 Tax=Aquabacter spiritensis TaxID=933073 RepID=A0A4R3LWJ8_9HYPH|nr:DMT family transporter [Aquabacter spiritensis]TCT04974.1 drug/metabolite transporter (DMT)-like permease [Aquabacter spiritensis]